MLLYAEFFIVFPFEKSQSPKFNLNIHKFKFICIKTSISFCINQTKHARLNQYWYYLDFLRNHTTGIQSLDSTDSIAETFSVGETHICFEEEERWGIKRLGGGNSQKYNSMKTSVILFTSFGIASSLHIAPLVEETLVYLLAWIGNVFFVKYILRLILSLGIIFLSYLRWISTLQHPIVGGFIKLQHYFK